MKPSAVRNEGLIAASEAPTPASESMRSRLSSVPECHVLVW